MPLLCPTLDFTSILTAPITQTLIPAVLAVGVLLGVGGHRRESQVLSARADQPPANGPQFALAAGRRSSLLGTLVGRLESRVRIDYPSEPLVAFISRFKVRHSAMKNWESRMLDRLRISTGDAQEDGLAAYGTQTSDVHTTVSLYGLRECIFLFPL
ncbi:hypothetical protein DFH06DRAFT_1366006 [Mycena polygramma]|nr:hypothetical protein DFH06DRAFT_1366006 [Mycena polygramma]